MGTSSRTPVWINQINTNHVTVRDTESFLLPNSNLMQEQTQLPESPKTVLKNSIYTFYALWLWPPALISLGFGMLPLKVHFVLRDLQISRQ